MVLGDAGDAREHVEGPVEHAARREPLRVEEARELAHVPAESLRAEGERPHHGLVAPGVVPDEARQGRVLFDLSKMKVAPALVEHCQELEERGERGGAS